MKDQRPKNLNLFKFKFPSTSIVSILHRISGVILFLVLPLLLWMLGKSLISADGFIQLQDCLSHPLFRLSLWVVLSAALFHLLAGIRHLLMDLGWGESLRVGTASAWIVMLSALVLMALAGIWLW